MRKILCVMLFLMLCSGCGPRLPRSLPEGIEITDGYATGLVQLVTLQDGTRCAVLIGIRKGAIHCEWKNHASH